MSNTTTTAVFETPKDQPTAQAAEPPVIPPKKNNTDDQEEDAGTKPKKLDFDHFEVVKGETQKEEEIEEGEIPQSPVQFGRSMSCAIPTTTTTEEEPLSKRFKPDPSTARLQEEEEETLEEGEIRP
jgi:hypothetical protein